MCARVCFRIKSVYSEATSTPTTSRRDESLQRPGDLEELLLESFSANDSGRSVLYGRPYRFARVPVRASRRPARTRSLGSFIDRSRPYGTLWGDMPNAAGAFMSDDDSTSYHVATRRPNKALPWLVFLDQTVIGRHWCTLEAAESIKSIVSLSRRARARASIESAIDRSRLTSEPNTRLAFPIASGFVSRRADFLTDTQFYNFIYTRSARWFIFRTSAAIDAKYILSCLSRGEN